MIREIIKITAESEGGCQTYQIGKPSTQGNLDTIVVSIEFKRDGLSTISTLQPCYLVTLEIQDPDESKKKIFRKMIPYNKLYDLDYIEIDKKKDKDFYETASSMKMA